MVAIAVLAGGIGWGAAQFIRSPAQAAADAAAPPASVLTATVERRVVKQTLVTRGSVAPGRTTKIQLRAPTTGEPIVTAAHVAVGDTIAAGAVLVEIAGRPVMAIHGTIPAYRNLIPGTTGEDVRQLQVALTEMGYAVSADGAYGASTAAAVQDWYRAAGFEPAPAGGDDAQRREAAHANVVAAERALEDLRDSGNTAPPRQTERAIDDLADARKKLAEIDATTGASVPAGEVVFLDSFPAQVRDVGVSVGGTVGEGTLTLSSGALEVTGTLSAQMTGLVREGQSVELVAEALGEQASGTVTGLIAATQGGTTTGGSGSASGPRFTIEPTASLPTAWNGQDVRTTVVAASSDGEVLVVPLAAVSSDAGGRTRVVVVQDGDLRNAVEVTTGVSGDGFVQVTALGPPLTVGDRVLVGTSTPTVPGARS